MLERCPLPAAPDVLEVGSGPGQLLRIVAELAGARSAVGVDPDAAMRAAGRGLDLREGRAEALPLPGASFDLAYFSLAFHWVADKPKAARELHRVLRPGGWAAIWTLTPEHVRAHHLNRYFPSLADVDLPRMETPELWLGHLAAAGFRPALEQQLRLRRVTTRARLAESVRARYISTLSMLPEAEFQAGLARLEAEARAAPRERVGWDLGWCLLWGRRPAP